LRAVLAEETIADWCQPAAEALIERTGVPTNLENIGPRRWTIGPLCCGRHALVDYYAQ